MNTVFDNGYALVTSYRNSKNYSDNWITSGYGLWFLREARYLNNARMILGSSCLVSGTGFLVHKDIINRNNGWNCFLLTEDIQFSTENIIRGDKIGYCADAMFYDEQPVRFIDSWNQRLRWSKGFYQVFFRYERTDEESLYGIQVLLLRHVYDIASGTAGYSGDPYGLCQRIDRRRRQR